MSNYGYPRANDLPFSSLEFGPPEVLDLTELRLRWDPWLRIEDWPHAPLRARHCVFLRHLLDEPGPAEPHWFGMVSPTSARAQVAAQSRRGELAAADPQEVARAAGAAGWDRLATALSAWPELDVPTRTTAVALLTQLGFHRLVVRLVPRPAATDAQSELLSYEVARAAHQYNRMSGVPMEVFSWLTEHARSPLLRLLSSLQLVSNQVREHRNADEAADWLARAAQLADALDGEKWLTHLGRSRFHRAEGLYHTLNRDAGRTAAAMTAALREDDALAVALPGSAAGQSLQERIRTHYQQENRRLVLEALLKLDTMTGSSSAPADAVAQLLELDAHDPDPRFTIGSFLGRRGDLDEAAGHYLAAAASGTVRGTHAAWSAEQCLRQLGRNDEAERTRQLLHDLDPAALPAPSPATRS